MGVSPGIFFLVVLGEFYLEVSPGIFLEVSPGTTLKIFLSVSLGVFQNLFWTFPEFRFFPEFLFGSLQHLLQLFLIEFFLRLLSEVFQVVILLSFFLSFPGNVPRVLRFLRIVPRI